MSQVKNALLAGLATKDQYDLCGFDYREFSTGPYQAQDPTELSAFGYSNGVNAMKFRGNNNLNSVVYEIWRRHGDTAAWALLATTKKQSFTDTPVTPGQYYGTGDRGEVGVEFFEFGCCLWNVSKRTSI